MVRVKSSEEPSYSEQFEILKGCTDPSVLIFAHPKPSKEAQALVPGALRLPFSNVYSRREARPLLAAETTSMPPVAAKIRNNVIKMKRCAAIVGFHAVALGFAYQTFSLRNLLIAFAAHVATTMIGIMFSYHRMLTHKSFKTYKWLEYVSSWIGLNAAQGSPIEWVSRVLGCQAAWRASPTTLKEGGWDAGPKSKWGGGSGGPFGPMALMTNLRGSGGAAKLRVPPPTPRGLWGSPSSLETSKWSQSCSI